MKISFLTAIILTSVLETCPNNGSVPVNQNAAACQAAENHLKEISCIPRDQPYTKKGKQFHQFCEETMNGGIDLSPKCLSEIKTCSQMNDCVQQKPQVQ